jgi:hypothetical protein
MSAFGQIEMLLHSFLDKLVNFEKKNTISFVMSVCLSSLRLSVRQSAWNNCMDFREISTLRIFVKFQLYVWCEISTVRIFVKFHIGVFFEKKYFDTIQVSLESDLNNGYFICSPMYLYVNIHLDSSQNAKYFRPKLQRISKHVLYVQKPLSKNRFIYEVMWKNMVDLSVHRIRRMRFACWITKARDTHWEYVRFIAFHGNNGYVKASQYYVLFPVFLILASGGVSEPHVLSVLLSGKQHAVARDAAEEIMLSTWQLVWGLLERGALVRFPPGARSFSRIPNVQTECVSQLCPIQCVVVVVWGLESGCTAACRLMVHTPCAFNVPTYTARRLHVTTTLEILATKNGTFWARNVR